MFDPSQCLQRTEGDKLVLVPRYAKAEMQAWDLMRRMDLGPVDKAPFAVRDEHDRELFLYPEGKLNAYQLVGVFDDPARFLAFSRDAVPVLRAEGWQVAFSEDYPYQIAEGEVGWWADVGEGSGIDWMSFELGIEFEGSRVNLVPTLAKLIGELPPDLLRAAVQEASATA